MSTERVTTLLAERVFGWKAGPDRYIKSGRSWIPKWRFEPFARLEDAFLLLDRAGGSYLLALRSDGVFAVEVQIGNRIGKACGEPKARAITLAISRALGIVGS